MITPKELDMMLVARLFLSLVFGMLGYLVGTGVQFQLNANITGNYQKSFLGDNVSPLLLAYVGAAIGIAAPWLWLLMRRNKTTNSPR